jgi:hypothetical protein
MCRRITLLLYSLLFIALAFIPRPATAVQIAEKTPTDVYRLTVILANHVNECRNKVKNVKPWPEVPPQTGKRPRHVMQKALEVLGKINLLRTSQKLGEISVPPYPARHITPNEVFDTVSRLIDEVKLLRQLKGQKQIWDMYEEQQTAGIRTSNDVYQNLWAISMAVDPILGVQGFTPADVYAQSQHIVDLVRFLRLSQSLPVSIKKPKRTTGKHPNHALQSTYKLLQKISNAEKNLWLPPADVPKVPKKVITPTEVYDAMQHVIAELQQIKFRLGVERYFSTPAVEPGKTPDDVIQNLEWATLMMPTFPLNKDLRQYNPASLLKTSDDTFAASMHALEEIRQYRATLGIQAKEKEPPQVIGFQPKHVYQKTMDAIRKVARLRRQNGLGALSAPRYPLRAITAGKVYDLVLRLDFEMEIIYRHAGIEDTEDFFSSIQATKISGKTPSDVYANVWRFSSLLDSILGTDGYSPDDLHLQVRHIISDLNAIVDHLGHKHKSQKPSSKGGYKTVDVITQAHKVLKLLGRVQKRAGIYSARPPVPPITKTVTASDVFNVANVIRAELASMQVFFGVIDHSVPLPTPTEKSSSINYQMLRWAELILLDLLESEHIENGEPL